MSSQNKQLDLRQKLFILHILIYARNTKIISHTTMGTVDAYIDSTFFILNLQYEDYQSQSTWTMIV